MCIWHIILLITIASQFILRNFLSDILNIAAYCQLIGDVRKTMQNTRSPTKPMHLFIYHFPAKNHCI